MQDKIILGLLLDGEKSSYEIQKTMEKSTGFFYNSSQGSIQPALKKLLLNGGVIFNEKRQGERVKKVYSITDEGKQQFLLWASQPIALEKPRDPALLKMFFSNNVTTDRKLEMIELYLDEIKQVAAALKSIKQISLEQIEKSKQPMDSEKMKSRMSTLDFGVDYYVFLNEWYEKYKERLIAEIGNGESQL
jgi:DNA-binding PadR family transcriptional regulator